MQLWGTQKIYLIESTEEMEKKKKKRGIYSNWSIYFAKVNVFNHRISMYQNQAGLSHLREFF